MKTLFYLFLVALLAASAPVFAQDAEEAEEAQASEEAGDAAAQAARAEEIARKLNNPVASLISVPIEYNKDSKIGPSETGEVWTLKASPVWPFDIHEDWNLITRTIITYVDQDIPDSGLNESGLSDIASAFYFSPKAPTASGIIWGIGPLFLLDTASEDSLGAGKWGAGPAGVILKQMGPWTIGALGHYLVDVGGDSDRADVEQLFFQPFLSYNFDPKLSMTLQSEITRDLEANETNAFAIFSINRTFKLGSQLYQGRVGVRHWYDQAPFGPDSTELMLRLTLLFPK